MIKKYKELLADNKNGRAFILGAGPSLFDLYNNNFHKIIKTEDSIISINASIIYCNNRLNWDIGSNNNRYWIANDSLILRWNWFNLIKKSICHKVIRDSLKKYNNFNMSDVYYFTARRCLNEKDGLISTSTAPSAIDFALQLGYKEIYLIGIDHEKKDGKNYFWQYFQKDKQPFSNTPSTLRWNKQKEMFNKNNQAYQILDSFAKSLNSKIYNCSDVALESNSMYQFKYKDLDELINAC